MDNTPSYLGIVGGVDLDNVFLGTCLFLNTSTLQ
jgi:hypothetical protein